MAKVTTSWVVKNKFPVLIDWRSCSLSDFCSSTFSLCQQDITSFILLWEYFFNMSRFSRTPSEGVAFNRIPSFVSDDGNGENALANDDEVHLVRYKGEMHNIHGFLNQHPGGRSILEKYENKDITAAFDDINHSAFASAKLSSYKLEGNKLDGQEVSLKKYNKVDADFVIKKLFTKEDQTNIHKVLGVLSLFSYLYRYGKYDNIHRA